MKTIIEHKIENVIKNVSNNKFLEIDDIINKTLILLFFQLIFIFQKIFQISLNKNYYSKYFKRSIIISFKKSKKKFFDIL